MGKIEDEAPGTAVTPSESAPHVPPTETKEPVAAPESYIHDEDDESLHGKKIRRIYRKLDRRILPAFWLLYFLCAAIRSNVGLSLTMNAETGDSLGQRLNLTPHQTSTGLALFYVCYVVFELPSNLIMTRISPNIWMSRIVICVGVIGACHAALSSAWNFYLLRILLGTVTAGMWPGMSYFLTLFYPPHRTGKRIGMYYTAAQLSAAVVSLVSAGFQKMNGLGGLRGYEWMFLMYGLVGIIVGVALLWWLPDRPHAPGEPEPTYGWFERLLNKVLPSPTPALKGTDSELHYEDLKASYHPRSWGVHDLLRISLDWRIWPLILMYFGVVGVGIGTQIFGALIIRSAWPGLTSIQISLLFAPIWIADLIAILIITPISDHFHTRRPHVFIIGAAIQITGLLTTTFAPTPQARYAGLILVGFGLGPTVPVTMAWTNSVFQPRHGDVGVAAATALVSGLGNLGSVVTTYALYTGWAKDNEKGPKQYRLSNLTMVGLLCMSIVAAAGMGVAVWLVDGKKGREEEVREGEGVVEEER